MLICRGTDGRTDGRTDARTHARTENIYSIFRDKLLLLGEHGLNQTVFFSPFLSKTNVVASRFYSGERQAGVLLLTPQPPKAFL